MEEKVEIEEALREEQMERQRAFEENFLLRKKMREKQEQRLQQEEEPTRSDIKRFDSWANSTFSTFKSTEESFKTLGGTSNDTTPLPSSLQSSVDDGEGRQEKNSRPKKMKKVSATPEDKEIAQIMKDHNSWMFNVLEHGSSTNTDADAVDENNDFDGTSEDDPHCHPETKVALKQVMDETTSKLQHLLFQLSTPNLLTHSPQNKFTTKPKIQALLSNAFADVLNAAKIEKEEALRKARAEHLKAMGVAMESMIQRVAEKRRVKMEKMEARHQMELAAARWNAGMAKENAREQQQRRREEKQRDKVRKYNPRRARSTASTLSSSDQSCSTSCSPPAPQSITVSPVADKKENALLPSERSLIRAEMEAVREEESAHKVRLALKQAKDISTKSIVKIEQQRRDMLETSSRYDRQTMNKEQRHSVSGEIVVSRPRKMEGRSRSVNIVQGGGGDGGVFGKKDEKRSPLKKMESKRRSRSGKKMGQGAQEQEESEWCKKFDNVTYCDEMKFIALQNYGIRA
eukprot:CAMPEP_0185727084 /NCGR_PEP_ID=MMETSP1171-20130828/2877_1 /TAXON_ID=374046 /ORGANISM="Helicotheca tamensis, Strain CCMP826" /LENGTH=515 /DNA_ID=CAMNT_0028395581 /DNA_START=271 /DNA_END=1818 /DNA_ORIENTATION=+